METVAQFLPFIGTGGGVAVVLGWMYRDPVTDALKAWAASRALAPAHEEAEEVNSLRDVERAQLIKDVLVLTKDVESMRTELANHTNREESYYHLYDGRLADISERATKLESNSAELRIHLERNHEEVIRSMGASNERLGELTISVRELTLHLLREKEGNHSGV